MKPKKKRKRDLPSRKFNWESIERERQRQAQYIDAKVQDMLRILKCG